AQFVLARTNTADRLVQCHPQFAPGANWPAIHRHLIVAGINLGAEQSNRLAVDAHAPVQNELFTGAARSDARVRQESLQTNHGKCRVTRDEWRELTSPVTRHT